MPVKTPKPQGKINILEARLLTRLLNVSADDHDVLEWAFGVLDDAEIGACLKAAKEIARADLESDNPAAMLTTIFAKTMASGVRWIRSQRGASKSARKNASPKSGRKTNRVGRKTKERPQ